MFKISVLQLITIRSSYGEAEMEFFPKNYAYDKISYRYRV